MAEGLYYEVDDIVTYLIVTCDDKKSVRSAQHVTHQKGLHATATSLLEVSGPNTFLFLSRYFCILTYQFINIYNQFKF